MLHCGLSAHRKASNQRQRSSRRRRCQERGLPRPGKTRWCDWLIRSLSIDLDITANARELNSNDVRAVAINRGAVGWFDPDFSFVLQCIRAVYICFSARTE